MKLLDKTNIYYIILSLAIFFAGCFAIYFSVVTKINSELTEHLLSEQKQVVSMLSAGYGPEALNYNIGDIIVVKPIEKITSAESFVRDTTMKEEHEDEYISAKQLTFQYKTNNGAYSVTISKSLSEQQEFTDSIVYIISALALIMLISLILLNRWVSKTIWSPFYNTLGKLKNFDLSFARKPKFKTTNIDEFLLLNSSIDAMAQKIINDYANLKEFTENASHEIQTPLAIIISKLELLLQTSGLTTEQAECLESSYNAAQRLSRLNQGLVWLARIENSQYQHSETVDLKEIILTKLDDFDDFINAKKIHVEVDIPTKGFVYIHPVLADILINNLLSNAVKHNIDSGSILIKLIPGEFSIVNTGKELTFSQEKAFDRFQRNNDSDSMGLGLAIVKRICNLQGWDIIYNHNNNLHTMLIKFPNESMYEFS